MPPPQDPYSDPESLFRAAYDDMTRTAYALLGNRADTEDATQNSFHRLMMAWSRVGGLPTVRKQRSYLIRIVINEALQILRYPHRRWERPDLNAVEHGPIQESLDENVHAREYLRLVWKAISELPGVRREVVILRAAGYEYDEIAAQLGITKSTVRSHISDARQQLSRAVPRDWEGEQE
jgi:RNA polymerase sigma-70 factor, ECF subfamily